MRKSHFGIVCLMLVGAQAAGDAHFKLLEPASWLVENDRGDPQKAGPCGGSNTDWGKPSYIVSKAVGGQKLHLKMQETIYHPGHYRVALAVNSPTSCRPIRRHDDQGQREGAAVGVGGDPEPAADAGARRRTVRALHERPTGTMAPFETDVELPNISCKKCTLQVVQFMAEHGFNNPGGYTYHHCADLQITADPSKPIDPGWGATATKAN